MKINNLYIIEKFLNYITIYNNKFLIAVDFDGTLAEHIYPNPNIGKKVKLDITNYYINFEYDNKYFSSIFFPTIEIIKYWKSLGNEIILWTCREDKLFNHRNSLSDAVNWCKSNGLIFDYINENHKNADKGRKIIADRYIDDKSSNIFDINTWNMNNWKLDYPTCQEIFSKR